MRRGSSSSSSYRRYITQSYWARVPAIQPTYRIISGGTRGGGLSKTISTKWILITAVDDTPFSLRSPDCPASSLPPPPPFDPDSQDLRVREPNLSLSITLPISLIVSLLSSPRHEGWIGRFYFFATPRRALGGDLARKSNFASAFLPLPRRTFSSFCVSRGQSTRGRPIDGLKSAVGCEKPGAQCRGRASVGDVRAEGANRRPKICPLNPLLDGQEQLMITRCCNCQRYRH